ncbi:hypothetical protein D3C72_1400580 [compost metagenome]
MHAQVVEQLVDPGIPGGGGHRLLDELGLAPFPMGRHDQAPGQLVGDAAAMVFAHQVEAAVQPGGGAGRGDEALIVHVEGIGIEPHGGKAAHEVLLELPMGRGPASLQQTGIGQHIGAQTEPHYLGTPVSGGNQGIEQGLGRSFGRIAPEGDDDDVSPDQPLQPVAGVDAKALGGTGLAGGIAGAESEFEQGGAWHHGVAEDEAGHSAVKGAEVIEGDDGDDDGIGHGGRLLCTRIPMIRGGNRKPKGHVVAWPSLIRGRWTRHPRVPAPALPSPVCRCSRAARAVSAGHD